MANYQILLESIFSYLKVGVIIIFVLLIFFGFIYYFLVIARRKKWYCRIWEQKADGRLALLGEDILVRQMLDFGKKAIYRFKKSRYYCSNPPTDSCVYRVGNKEYVDYLRVGIAYYPLEFKDDTIDEQIKECKKTIIKSIKDKFNNIIFSKKRHKINNEKVLLAMYIPMIKNLVITSKYTPMSYDLDMMRMASIDTREQMYKKQETFWEKYKEPIVWGILILSIIIVGYLSFEYMSKVMSQNINMCSSIIDKCLDVIPNVTNFSNIQYPPS